MIRVGIQARIVRRHLRFYGAWYNHPRPLWLSLVAARARGELGTPPRGKR
jgi:hypothetical protein